MAVGRGYMEMTAEKRPYHVDGSLGLDDMHAWPVSDPETGALVGLYARVLVRVGRAGVPVMME